MNARNFLEEHNIKATTFRIKLVVGYRHRRRMFMKHVVTLNEKTLKESLKRGGCGECQTSCQSACKTSCTVGNQGCENPNR